MKVAKTILLIVICVALGIASHMIWQYLLTPSATVSGILQQESETDPAVSASYPAGFYVESRVYLDTASQEMLGQKVSAWGNLDLARDPNTPSYPKIKNKKVTVLK